MSHEFFLVYIPKSKVQSPNSVFGYLKVYTSVDKV